MRLNLLFYLFILLSISFIACSQDKADPIKIPTKAQTNCGSDSPKIGQSGEFSNLENHGISGSAEITDNCTITIKDFNYDGKGPDVFFVVSNDGDFANGTNLSTEKLESREYKDETITLTLPEGITLSDVKNISAWCHAYSVNFGEAVFQ